MADNIFGKSMVTPKGVVFFLDADTPNTLEKHPKNKYPSDKFDITIGFKKDTDLSELKAECERVATQAFKTTTGIDMPFANGDEKSLTSMAGYIIVRSKCSKRPGLVNGAKERILENEFDAGMWGKAHVSPMSYTSGKNKGISLILKNVQIFTQDPYDSLGSEEKSPEDIF